MNLEELKSEIENGMQVIIDKYNCGMDGEKLDPHIHSITEENGSIRVCFNDEGMGYFVSGFVSSSAWDEYDALIDKLGYYVDDCDFNVIYLSKN